MLQRVKGGGGEENGVNLPSALHLLRNSSLRQRYLLRDEDDIGTVQFYSKGGVVVYQGGVVVQKEVWWSRGSVPASGLPGPGSNLGQGPPHSMV